MDRGAHSLALTAAGREESTGLPPQNRSFAPPSDDLLYRGRSFAAHRFGRYLVAELLVPHRVVSTSACGGGQRDDIRFVANHQSCEATDDRERHDFIAGLGPIAYHRTVCGEMGTDPDHTALMGTAANMAYAVHRSAVFDDLRVDVFATGGVTGNAARAGDPAAWTETGDGWQRAAARAGTMTEAKSAALAELAVPSRYSPTIATGTGTDLFCVGAPLDPGRPPKTSTGPHAKLGEIIGVAVRDAIKEALRWQNGPEASYTRGLFHALGRFGLTEARAMERLADLLPGPRYELLDKNRRAVFYDPGVSAAAHALAAVLDRLAFGTLPAGTAGEALRQQAACLACALAARPEEWPAFRAELAGAPDDPVDLALRAVALGWNAKWT